MAARTLFATRLYESELTDGNLLKMLASAIRDVAAADEPGRRFSEDFGYSGYCGCATQKLLHTQSTLFAELARWVTDEAGKFADECAFDLQCRPELSRMWANVLRSDGHHRSHVHAHAIISGCLFVEAPRDCGAVCFEDPRLPLMMAAPGRRNGAPEDLHSVVTVEPRPGMLLLWESWLRHEILTGRGSGDRISITFDFNQSAPFH